MFYVFRDLKDARLDKTILRRAKGLTPELLAHCKARGAIVDEVTTPSTSPSQNAAVTSSQEAILQASPSPSQAVPSTSAQEATSEAVSSQEHLAVEKGTSPSTPPSQDHVTPSSPSQDTAS